jgi:NADPH-dependent 2,4-dienoyl-CoA reductase/sulfur reductase-like enzyme
MDEFMPGGTTVEDSKIIIKEAERAGASIIHAWAGWHESPKPMLPMSVPRGAFVYLASAAKEAVSIPVVAVGRINDPKLANEIVGRGGADLVAFGRAFLADPYFPQKAVQGRLDDIRKCIACCRCFDTIMTASPPIVCAVNAELGREGQNLIRPAEKKKRILVVGGGPAGMEAARVAKLRGHDVTLWEKGEGLGGNLILAAKAPHKEEIANLTHYLIHELENLKVKIELSKEITAEKIIQANADEVILATGSLPIVPQIPGVDRANVVTAIDVLSGREIKGGNILVVGGGMVGCEVAEFLEHQGKKVTIIEMLDRIAKDIGPTTAWVVRQRIKEKGIIIFTKAKLISIEDDGITVDREGGRESLKGDIVVLATGLKPDNELMESLKGKVSLHFAGDCVEVAKILEAIHGGFKVGCEV